MFKFDAKKVNRDEEVGSGAQARVYAYKKNEQDQAWVVKTILTNSIKQLLNQIQEIVLGYSCDHPNILPVKGYYIHYDEQRKDFEIFIKLPRMQMSLKSKCDHHEKNGQPIEFGTLVKYFYSIACGISYLHNKNIAHRDIKPDNILLNEEKDEIKIGDIGLGKLIDNESSYLDDKAGTRFYSAPEILNNCTQLKKKDLYKADVWSLGMLMAKLFLLKSDFIDVNSSGKEKETQFIKAFEKIKNKENEVVVDLVLQLLRNNPDERISINNTIKILQENYPEILGLKKYKIDDQNIEEDSQKEKEPVRVKSISELKNQLEKTNWSSLFKLETIENQGRLGILPRNPKWLKDENVLGLFKELEKEIKSDEYKKIESLAFSLRNCTEISSCAIQDVTYFLKNTLQDLQALELSFSRCHNFNGETIQKLGKQFESLKKLRELNINFTNCQNIKERPIIDFCRQLNHLDLEDLSFSFKNCDIFTDQTIVEFAKQIVDFNLKRLKLDFACSKKLKDDGFVELFSQIGNNLKNLRHIYFDFGHCEGMNNKSVSEISKQIEANLRKLTQISLIFLECKGINKSSVECLAKSLGTLENIDLLKLHFSSSNNMITDDSIIRLINQTDKNMKNLKYFELYLPGHNNGITDNVIKTLCKTISLGRNIQHLGLCFTGCMEITDSSFEELINCIGNNLQNLRSLCLNFKGCRKIRNQTIIEDFVEKIAKDLRELESVSFNFK